MDQPEPLTPLPTDRPVPGAIETPRSAHVYFRNLDGLRFFAFLSVFFQHAFAADTAAVRTSGLYQQLTSLAKQGRLGVNFFFVLSGFLITYLLLQEERLTKRIHVGSFYVRRVLRIWPLYFVTCLIGFFVLPYVKHKLGGVAGRSPSPWYFVTFTVNFDRLAHGPPDFSLLGVLWSVAVEEQFYLVWPLLLMVFRKHRLVLFCTVIVGSLLFRAAHAHEPDVLYYHTLSAISDMAVGGLAGWVAFHPSGGLHRFSQAPRVALIGAYLAGVLVILGHNKIFVTSALLVVERLVFSIFFAFVILEQTYALHSPFKVGRLRRITEWGKYTYGLYCLHLLAIYIALNARRALRIRESLAVVLVGDTLVAFLVVLALAWTSYHLYEKRFLALKDRFGFVTRR